jgi:hypothetical protein
MNWLRSTLSLKRLYAPATAAEAVPGHARRLRKSHDAGALVVSFPKSGRTWHRLMLGYYLAVKAGASERDAFELPSLCDALRIPHIAYTHGGAAFNDGLPALHPAVADPAFIRGKRVLLLLRDPRDIIVSAFFHARDREKTWAGSIGEFVRDESTGIAKVLTSYTRWFAAEDQTVSFDAVSYEETHVDPALTLRRSLRFAGLAEVDEALVERSVQFARFDNMRTMEERAYFQHEAMRRTGGSDTARKVRSGRVGGYLQHLSAADLVFIDEAIARAGGPMAERYGPPPRAAVA